MSQGERTERATPKKRHDARERGEVLKSAELNTAVLILLGFGVLLALAGFIARQAITLFTNALSPAVLDMQSFGTQDLGIVFVQMGLELAVIVGPILLATAVVGIAINYLQVGFLFTTKPLAPKFSRINPFAGFKRMFSVRSLVELLKSVGKVIIIYVMVNSSIREFIDTLPGLMGKPLDEVIAETMTYAFILGIKIGAALLAIGVADYLFQWWRHEKDMRMTKQEVKDEYKLSEGDPQIKGRIKNKQREMAAMRMMQSVPDADVIITNPTHYAVALKYDDSVGDAPVVLAKGKDYLALKIKEIGREHRVEMVENKPLAQSLYAMCEVGDAIPENLYHAVAEILAYIYRAKEPAVSRQRGQRAAGANTERRPGV